jgi:hypothetical protein
VVGGYLPHRSGYQALSNSLFARQLARAPHGFSLLSRRPVRGLLIEAPPAHLSEHTFALHLPLQDAKRLLDIIVSNEYLHALLPLRIVGANRRGFPESDASRCQVRKFKGTSPVEMKRRTSRAAVMSLVFTSSERHLSS